MNKQTIESNKLIAKFMGLTIITDGISWFDTDYRVLKKYHESWDGLIPVVEKIERIGVSVTIKTLWNQFTGNNHTQVSVIKEVGRILNGGKCMTDIVREYENHSNTSYSKIEAVWQSVVEFINWYNNEHGNN